MTLVEGRTIKPGHKNDFYAWIHRTLATNERFPGSQGVTILTLGKGPSAVRYVIHRFADETTGLAWVNSEERAALMREAAAFSTPYTQTASGPEAWFTLPEMSGTAPPKWKLFLTTIPSAYLASLVIVLIIGAFLHDWPLLVTVAIVTVFLAFMLTYVGLPVSTRILRSWLYPPEKGSAWEYMCCGCCGGTGTRRSSSHGAQVLQESKGSGAAQDMEKGEYLWAFLRPNAPQTKRTLS